MELHHSWRARIQGQMWLCGGVLLLFSPWLLDKMGYEFLFGNWVGYLMAIVFFVAGVVELDSARRPLKVLIDPDGVSWQKEGKPVRVLWRQITRVSFDRPPNSGLSTKSRLLTVWMSEPPAAGPEPDVLLQGLSGFRVADIRKTKEPLEDVHAALRRCSGHHYQRIIDKEDQR
jgi:hypothetical protein